MILGFAHVTRNVRSGTLQVPPIASASEKWPLMARHATSHRLFMEGPQPGPLVELVEYDTGVVERAGSIEEQQGRIGIVGASLVMRMQDRDAEYGFFIRGLGFVPEVGRLFLSSAVKYWQVRILAWIDPDAPLDPPLDIAGYAALAFYSSDLVADLKTALVNGGRLCTQPFTVKLDREMRIVMLRSPEGTIIELIQVMP